MIDPGYFWLIVALLTLGTVSIRFSLIAISGKMKVSPRAKELFSYIPAAILPALVAPMVFFHQGSVAWLAGKERAAVLALTTILCAFTKSTLLTILFGLAALYLVHAL